MSDASNPYQSPRAESEPAAALTNQGVLTENMLFYLRGASPWLRFIGVLTYIGSGFMVAAGLVMMVVMPGFSGISLSSFTDGWMRGLEGVAGLIYIIGGVIIFFPARFTYNFGAKIRTYLQNNTEQELELAFKNNKSLWKFYGILSIVYLAFIPVALVIGIIAAIGFAAF
jgi:hypothetical protein